MVCAPGELQGGAKEHRDNIGPRYPRCFQHSCILGWLFMEVGIYRSEYVVAQIVQNVG